jgi:membrane complex biogenesis BtpA family protein
MLDLSSWIDSMLSLQPPILIGMVHLPALPGSPNNQLPLDGIVRQAVADATTLKDAGFSAVMVENFGDAPFSPDRVDPVTIASMAVVTREVIQSVDIPTGINVLRNDAAAGIAIAAVINAHFIRVNVHVGVAATDQGIIEGRAADTLRLRQRLGRDVGILADVHVKHASPLSQPDIALAAEETAYRGQADMLIVSGATTGRAAALDDLARVRNAVPDRPLLVGSGLTVDTVAGFLAVADGAIVGSSLKPGKQIHEPIDAAAARAFVAAARGPTGTD